MQDAKWVFLLKGSDFEGKNLRRGCPRITLAQLLTPPALTETPPGVQEIPVEHCKTHPAQEEHFRLQMLHHLLSQVTPETIYRQNILWFSVYLLLVVTDLFPID